jgi:hypothetical protein
MLRYLVFACLILAFFYGCTEQRVISPISKDQLQLLSCLPSDSKFIMYLNKDKLNNSLYWNNYLEEAFTSYNGSEWFDEISKKNGFLLENEIKQFLFAALDDEVKVFVYQFRGPLLDSLLDKKNGFTAIKENKFYTFNNRNLYFYKINDSVLVVTNRKGEFGEKTFKSAIQNTEVLNSIQSIGKKSEFWMIADNESFDSEKVKNFTGKQVYKQFNKIKESLNYISLSAEFNEKVEIESIWECNNRGSSGLLSSAARSAIAMDLFADKEYALGEMMDKVSVTTIDRNVCFKVNLDQKDIKELKNIAEKRNLDKKL